MSSDVAKQLQTVLALLVAKEDAGFCHQWDDYNTWTTCLYCEEDKPKHNEECPIAMGRAILAGLAKVKKK